MSKRASERVSVFAQTLWLCNTAAVAVAATSVADDDNAADDLRSRGAFHR